jgi:acyl-CoA synthetase (AMP-forming)/AMP-acid ligase II
MTNRRRNDALHSLAEMKCGARFLDPRFVWRLRAAGAVDRREVSAFLGVLPSMFGRGPSLGTLSQINARAVGSKIAIHDRHGSLTWRDLDRRSNRLARALIQRDLPRDALVATLLRNGREAVEAILATQKLGLGIAPLNTWATPSELRGIIGRSAPTLLIYDDLHEGQVREALGERTDASTSYEALLEGQPEHAPPPFVLERGSPRILTHTSGTTGSPKAASRRIGQTGTRALMGLLEVIPFRRDDVFFCPAPLFHSFGLLTFSMAALLGATLVLPERFEPEESLSLIEQHGATAASFVPVMVRRILSLPPVVRGRYFTGRLRIVLTSGSAMSPELRARARGTFGDVLYDLYGSTEAGWVAVATPRDVAEAPATVGRPVGGVEVMVFDDRGSPVPPNERGRILVRSDAVFEGYASGDGAGAQAPLQAIDTGDVGWIDDEGRLFVEGRADDMVVIGGENVYPAEIEAVISTVRGVVDVAVLGISDQEYGHALAAYVQGTADLDEIRSACRAQLSSFKVPKVIEIVDDLPRTATGKIRKGELASPRGPSRGRRRSA